MKSKFNNCIKHIVMTVFAAIFSCSAETVQVSGGSVSYAGASEIKTLPDGDVLLVFTNTIENSSFTLPRNAKARVLAVAGGGAGGVSDHEYVLKPGSYTVNVGAGGKRVQTIVQSWTGSNGQNSEMYHNDAGEERLMLALGGGGGGTVKVNGRGEDGGSGGGGSWYGTFTRGGTAVDGQGWPGGISTNTFNGAGGGGAATNNLAGIGKPNGDAGEGRVLDITGEEVLYSRGGRGGLRNNRFYVARDGAGYGFGGDGAGETGAGGAGGDGIVVVRIHKLFDYTRVPIPEAFPFPTWTNNTTYVAFDESKVTGVLAEAMDYVEGITFTNTSVVVTNAATGASVTNGIGRFHYIIHLKEDYVWDDGTPDGSERPLATYWRIKPLDTINEAAIETTKTVTWSEGTDAKIGITIKAQPEMIARDPRTLILGAVCGAHEFGSDIVNAAMNAAAEKGSVDCYLFRANASTTVSPAWSDSLAKGETRSGRVVPSGGNEEIDDIGSQHGVLYEFYDQLSKVIDEIDAGTREPYDYIVLSFDRGLVGASFVGKHPAETKVVEFMRDFYAKKAVIWLVDCESGSDAKLPAGITQTPWYPCPIAFASYGANASNNKWHTLDYYVYKWGANAQKSSPYGFVAYKAMLGMFDPDKYDTMTQATYGSPQMTGYGNNRNPSDGFNNAEIRRLQNLSGQEIDNQVIYDNAANVAEMIRKVVEQPPATVRMLDTVYADAGLSIIKDEGTEGEWTTNAVTQGWVKLTDDEFIVGDTGVSLKLDNIFDPIDIRLSIKVRDDGLFRTSINAKLNPRTGLWEKDPNNGPVHVEIAAEASEGVMAEDEAKTAVAWSYPTYKVTCEIVDWDGTPFPDPSMGERRGQMVVNGFITNYVEVAAGNSPEVVFRGKGGYVLSYLEVDGQPITDFDPNLYNWIFNEVSADHDIKVGFKQLFTVPWPQTGPTTNIYDGTAWQPTILAGPTFIDNYDYQWEAVFSATSNGVYTTDFGQTNVVFNEDGEVIGTNIYVRMKIYQPGYEDGVVIDYWTGIDEVVVTQRFVTVQFDDYAQTSNTRKEEDFAYSVVDGIIIPGDTLVEDPGQCTDYPEKGDKTEDSITSLGEMTVTTPDCPTSNYIVTVLPGDYYWPVLNMVATAPNIVRYYDGRATGTTARVVYPTGPTSQQTGNWITFQNGSSTTPTSNTNAGDGKVRYRWITNALQTVIYYGTNPNSTPDSTTRPTFTDVGDYTVYYRATGSCEVRLERQECKSSGYFWNRTWSWDSSTYPTSGTNNGLGAPSKVDYDPYDGTARVRILPRTVTVTAHDAAKKFDGEPLVQSGHTISPTSENIGLDTDDGRGFSTNEGYAQSFPKMTAASTITYPGRTTNRIDSVNMQNQLKTNTKIGNYSFKFIDGLLVVSNNQLKVTVEPREKIYNGKPLEDLQFVVTDEDGKIIPIEKCTFTYGRNLDGSLISERPKPLTDVDYLLIPYTVTSPGYGNAVSGETYMRVYPRKVTLQAKDAEKIYDGEPLTYDDFEPVPGEMVGADGKDTGYGFVGAEGIAAVTMTGDSEITDPGKTANKIDTSETGNWEPLPGTKMKNYTFDVLPGELTVKPWLKRSLMIIDHEPLTNDWVYLAFLPRLFAGEEQKEGWVMDMATNNLFAVKYGLTRSECDKCVAADTELSDLTNSVHKIREDKIWIRVELAKLREANPQFGEDFDPGVGFWRINVRPKDVGYSPPEPIKILSTPAFNAQAEVEPTLDDVIDQDEPADSVNMFGILKIESKTTNTMVAIPWTWYSERQIEAEDIPVRKLVKATNLTDGDMVYATTDGGVTYTAWRLYAGEWEPVVMVNIDAEGVGRMLLNADKYDPPETYTNATRVARGNGVWVIRQKPVDEAGNVIPFWIYGQSVTMDVTTPVPAPTGDQTVVSTMLGSPYAREVRLNPATGKPADIIIEGDIDPVNDHIWYYTPEGEMKILTYKLDKGWARTDTMIINGRQRSVVVYDTVIPPGIAFWYDRRGKTDLRIIWTRDNELK